jgi:hypothetical protein
MAVNPSSTTGSGAPTAERKVSFAALRHRDYRRYFLVNLFSTMGDNIEHVISYWLLYQKFHCRCCAGFAVISHWTPFFIFFGLFLARSPTARLPARHSSGATDVRQCRLRGRFISYGYHRSLASLLAAGDARHVRRTLAARRAN